MRLTSAIEGYWLARRRDLSQNTINDYRRTYARFLPFVGTGRNIADITTADIHAYLNHLTDELHLAPHTVRNHWIALSALWTWAENELAIPHVLRNKVSVPRVPRVNIEPFSQDDLRKLLSACDHNTPYDRRWTHNIRSLRPTGLRDRALILALVDTGIRASELCDLTLADLNTANGQLTIQRGKGKKPRIVFLGDTARKALWRYLATRPEAAGADPLFASRTNHRLDRTNVRHILARIGQRAQVPGAHPHRFRHTYAINFLRNGGNPIELQELLGHSTMETVRIYARLAEIDLQRAQKRASPADHWRL